jgi:two-component system response regulator RegA
LIETIALGYAPVQARTVQEAEEALLSAERDPPAAIIDMSTPGISNDEAFRILKRAKPDLKAIIVSGYRHDARIDAAIREGAFDFLQTPYSLRNLSLHRMLAPPADPLPPPQADAMSPGE